MIRESTIFLPPLLLGSIPFTKSNFNNCLDYNTENM